ncbi:MAG: acyl-CoA dehydratase activase [Spirochaetia bacterium]
MKNKQRIIAIDAGSVSISIVEIDSTGEILQSGYRFHAGDVVSTAKQMLKEFSPDDQTLFVKTSSTPNTIQAGYTVNNQIAEIEFTNSVCPEAGALLQVGGERFNLILFDENGRYLKSKGNTSCAAGTGSFLDQQAGRLGMEGIEEFCSTAESNDCEVPKIASRCAVFAKTDLIHAQQEGHSYEAISEGLCRGLAKNIVDTLFHGEQVQPPLVFTGGVSLNSTVCKWISELTGLDPVVPQQSNISGAVGAALHFLEISDKTDMGTGGSHLFDERKKEKHYGHPELTLHHTDYPDFDSLEQYLYNLPARKAQKFVEVDIYEKITENTEVYLGIDIGSTSTKAVITSTDNRVLAGFYTRTAGKPVDAFQCIFEAIRDIETKKEVTFTFLGTSTTGSGRKFIAKIIDADLVLDEITAHARAAVELDPEVDTIIEIGGQDSKFTTLRNGMVTGSTMNNVCAAGTGSFIEEQAKKLGCKLTDYADRTDGVKSPVSSSRCTVFMERDLNHLLNEGYTVEEVLASALHAVRENYLQKVATEANIGSKVFFQGATAKNRSLVASFEQKLNRPILVSKFCHLTGALGAALSLSDSKVRSEKFRGLSLYKETIPVTNEVCELCTNHCKITVAQVGGTKVAFGFLCGRDYDTKQFKNKNTSGFDLVKAHKKALHLPKTEKPNKEGFTIGLPYALYMVEDFPLWQRFFQELGIQVITSEHYKDPISDGKILTGAEFCAPMTALHGHVAYLAEKCDAVFLPVYLETKPEKEKKYRQMCYYTQFAPTIAADSKGGDTLISPMLKYRYTPMHVKIQLQESLNAAVPFDITFEQISQAFDTATEFSEVCQDKLETLFNENKNPDTDVNIVFLGRPYTVLAPAMNKGIPDIFASLGIRCFFQDMVGYSQEEVKNVAPLVQKMTWHYGAQIIETAEAVAQMEGCYPVFITSFECSPDSFVQHYFKGIMDAHNKPYLMLELDEHGSSVGYETRIEAAIRAFRNHYSEKKKPELDHKKLDNKMPYLAGKVGGKTILLPNLDPISLPIVAANLKSAGYDARLLEESPDSIRRSLAYNTGQCIPVNIMVQNAVDYIHKYNLDPANTLLWVAKSDYACNIKMYPHYMRQLLLEYKLPEVQVYAGEISFLELSPMLAINTYFAYMFGGLIRRIGCRIRPYELVPGITDKTIDKSVQLLIKTFQNNENKQNAVKQIVSWFQSIPRAAGEKPKVAIFGDLYVRDNDIMNQDLVRFIEENGGEVVTTPFSEFAKITSKAYFRRWWKSRNYKSFFTFRTIFAAMRTLEGLYSSLFNQVVESPDPDFSEPIDKLVERFNMYIEHNGESVDNALKITHLAESYDDLVLLVQTSPSFCCPGLITEATKKTIQEQTGVPIVSITYDGTGGRKNEAIVPYLAFTQKIMDSKKSIESDVT